MTWQEELRKLDEELAAGRMSADDYRVRRDQVLSSAVSPGSSGDQQEPTQFVSWSAHNPAPIPGDADETQVVPDDADRTQAVPGVPPQNLVGGMPPRPAPGQGPRPYQQGWQNDEHSAPWASSNLPPLAAHVTPDWVRQGPEVFEESRGPGKGLLVAIGVVLVAAIVGAGIWWSISRGGQDEATPPPSSSQQQPTSSSTPRPLDGIAGGEIDEEASGEITVAQAAENNQFSPEEAAILGECQAEEGEVQVLFQETWFTQVHAFRCDDTSAQQETIEKLLEQQKKYGFTALTVSGGLPGMIIENATDIPEAPVDARVFYASDDNIVRVEVRGHSRASVDDGLAEVLTAVTDHFSAN